MDVSNIIIQSLGPYCITNKYWPVKLPLVSFIENIKLGQTKMKELLLVSEPDDAMAVEW